MDYMRSDVGLYPSKIIQQYENPGKKESDARINFNRPVYQMRGTENGKKNKEQALEELWNERKPV